MEYFLNKVSQQAVSFAIRTGIVVTSQFALKQCGRYISSIKGSDRRELIRLQERLENTIRIVSPAIDLVEIISARGNTSLESALTLTKNLRHEIQELGVRLSGLTQPLPGKKKRQRSQEEVNAVMEDIRRVLVKIEEAVPFISLAVTTSGVNISSEIPHSVSPSRLLQASTLLTAGDTAYTLDPFRPAQIGTSFTLTLYMLFASHTHRQDHVSASDLTWQEVFSKCKVKLQRVPLFYEDHNDHDKSIRGQHKTEEFCYELCLIEDLDDGRVHDATPVSYEDVAHAGMRVRIPVHQIAKMFYTTSGKLLGIEESSSPILLIKRDKNAIPPRRLVERAQGYEYEAFSDSDDEDSDGSPGYQLDLREGESVLPDHHTENLGPETSDFPPHLDPEWLAFEVFQDPIPDDDESDSGAESDPLPTTSYTSTLSTSTLSPSSRSSTPTLPSSSPPPIQNLTLHNHRPPTLPISNTQTKSTLSILECLLRLTILQNYQQTSHLSRGKRWAGRQSDS
ncbi:Ran-binding-domain-containing protein [Ascodesmis nigricans]|uniref:Ran-binding-domain-containing protein n=1 Tax=Ascodesmis nigricans TaxID=341454 RepID=A0A4S2MM78_9PEZI|nr:Ran-binding-domain-containing protein [Ascodesmis nigricans]